MGIPRIYDREVTMKKLSVLIAAAALAALMALPASPAQASSCVDVHKAGDPSWATVCNRQTIAVCDADPDGHMVYAKYWPLWYNAPSLTGYDSYGYTNGQYCHHEDTHSAWGIDRFQVCIQTEGCSVWKDAG